MSRRHAVLLQPQAACEDLLLTVHAPYRVDGSDLDLHIDAPGGGQLLCTLEVPASGLVWTGGPWAVGQTATLRLELSTGTLRLSGERVGVVEPFPSDLRRFELDVQLQTPDGRTHRRRTGHYVPRRGAAIDERYYRGDDYTDYETQSAGSTDLVIDLISRFGCQGTVLEVGCATGATLAALRDRGLPGVGVDISNWAIEQASQRLGPDHVAALDLEREDLPARLAGQGPFGCLVMASVFEHFSAPFDVLARLGRHVRPGGHVVITTTNADSLTHRLFGKDWEGFFDWTHHGIEAVTPATLRARIPPLGWRVEHLHTWHVWDSNADPTHATFREWHDADARFRQLLAERELGDFLACVARRVG